MRVIAKRTLREFWVRHADAEGPLLAWYREVEKAKWTHPNDIKAAYRTASFVGNDRVVFNIKGNAYRLIVAVNYDYGTVLIRFVGTHVEYDKVNARKV